MNLKNKLKYNVIGLMSGTSLDGVDIAFCAFELINNKWSYSIEKAITIGYTDGWKKRLQNLEKASSLIYQQTNIEYGHYLGELVYGFINSNNLKVDFIASHGHTIFHSDFNCDLLQSSIGDRLNKKLTSQIGAGSEIAAICGLPVVSDFRVLDVALGGQGAPLVPIGDEKLFGNYDYCLNLGGFVNISYENNNRIAFDICPVNIVLNELCLPLNIPFDDGGKIAASGKVNIRLLSDLNALEFYHKELHQPKSLGKEWVVKHINPLLRKHKLETQDAMCTFCEHVAMQIAKCLVLKKEASVLITGGGAFNHFLLSRIENYSKIKIVVPSKMTINFKESLIFAFLGVLRFRQEVNTYKSVTGARKDSVGGSVFYG